MSGLVYAGFQPTALTQSQDPATALLVSYTEPFNVLQRTQFKDASLTLAGADYPKNADLSCDLPIYFTEKITEGANGGRTWLRTVNLQDYVTKTDDGKMLTSWTTNFPDVTQHPEEITPIF